MADKYNTVLIIGSGATGLALAQGLKLAGIPCIVFEKRTSLHPAGERDWNMGLHWGAPILQGLLNPFLWAEIQSVHVDPSTPVKDIDTLSFVNGATGENMGAGIAVQKWFRLRRSKLRSLLATNVDIRYGKKITRIAYASFGARDTVIAQFEDGSVAEGRILIGADGARSSVRRLIAGPDTASITRLPYAATFVQARYTREQALFLRSFHSLYIAAPHPKGLFAFFGLQDAPNPDAPETWTFFFYISWPSSLEQQDEEKRTFTTADRLKQLRALAMDYAEPWKSAMSWLPDTQSCFYAGMTVWDPSLPMHWWWNQGGRVTLAGDAAHPMTYQRGQGLNHSITDSGKLLTAIKSFMSPTPSADQATAIDSYEKEMKARGGEEVRLSEINTRMLHDWAKVLKSPLFTSGMTASK